MHASAEKLPNSGLNGASFGGRNEEFEPPDPERIVLAIEAMDRVARNARIVRALEKAIVRLERERAEMVQLWDDLERYYLYDLGCLADEVGDIGTQIARFTEQIHLLKGEGWVHG